MFRGREMTHPERGRALLMRLAEERQGARRDRVRAAAGRPQHGDDAGAGQAPACPGRRPTTPKRPSAADDAAGRGAGAEARGRGRQPRRPSAAAEPEARSRGAGRAAARGRRPKPRPSRAADRPAATSTAKRGDDPMPKMKTNSSAQEALQGDRRRQAQAPPGDGVAQPASKKTAEAAARKLPQDQPLRRRRPPGGAAPPRLR